MTAAIDWRPGEWATRGPFRISVRFRDRWQDLPKVYPSLRDAEMAAADVCRSAPFLGFECMTYLLNADGAPTSYQLRRTNPPALTNAGAVVPVDGWRPTFRLEGPFSVQVRFTDGWGPRLTVGEDWQEVTWAGDAIYRAAKALSREVMVYAVNADDVAAYLIHLPE